MLRLMQHPGRHAAAVRGREQISGLVSGIPVTINPTTTATTTIVSDQTTTQGLPRNPIANTEHVCNNNSC